MGCLERTFSGNGIGFPVGGIFLGSGESLFECLILLLGPEGVEGSSVALRLLVPTVIASVSGTRNNRLAESKWGFGSPLTFFFKRHTV